MVDEEGVLKKIRVPCLKPGEKGVVKIRTKHPICLEKYEEFPDLGRFALRRDTYTLASGKITRFKPYNWELLKNNNYFLK